MTTFQIGTTILAGGIAFLVYVAYDMRRATREALHKLGVVVFPASGEFGEPAGDDADCCPSYAAGFESHYSNCPRYVQPTRAQLERDWDEVDRRMEARRDG